MPENRLKIGVYGLGMGANLLPLNGEPEGSVRVEAICTRSREKLDRFKNEFHIEKAYTDYEKLLSDDEIDVIAVYTPDALHGEHCVLALEAGKHVICTKPMTAGLEDALRIQTAVKKSGRRFMVAQTARYTDQYSHMKSILDQAGTPKIHACRGQYIHDLSPYLKLTPWRLEMPQDIIYGGGLHPIDLLYWYAGDIDEVYAYAEHSRREPAYPMEDNFILLLKFSSGAIGTVSILCGVYHPPVPIIEIDIFHERGSVTATYTEGEPGTLRYVTDRLDSDPVQEIEYSAETGITYQHGESERKIIRYFADCILSGRDTEPSLEDSIKCIAVCDAAWRSIREGRPVTVADLF